MTMLSARLRELGIESFHMEAVKDDPTVMSEKLKEAAKSGRYDHHYGRCICRQEGHYA